MEHEVYWSGRGIHKALTERVFPGPTVCIHRLYHTLSEQQPVLLSFAIRKGISVVSLEKFLRSARPSRPVIISDGK